MNSQAENYINKLNLEPHPEGGYFKEVYHSDEMILPGSLPSGFRNKRNLSTSIYFLLEGDQLSYFHRLKSDEIWHFYDGCSILIFVIDNSGNLFEYKLGRNLENNEKPQTLIKNNHWFAAELIDKNYFCLVGCTVSPGFDFEDFEIAKEGSY